MKHFLSSIVFAVMLLPTAAFADYGTGTGSLFGSGSLVGVTALCNGFDVHSGTTEDGTGTYEQTMSYCNEWVYMIEKPMLEWVYRSLHRIVFDAALMLLVIGVTGYYLIGVVYKFFFRILTRYPVRPLYSDRHNNRFFHKKK